MERLREYMENGSIDDAKNEKGLSSAISDGLPYTVILHPLDLPNYTMT